MAFFTGLFNSTTGFIIRILTAAIIGVVIWFAFDLFVHYVLNFLATIGEDGPTPQKFNSQDAMFFYIKIGLIVIAAFLVIVKGGNRKGY